MAVNSNDPASPPCRRSVGTRAGSVSVGGSCSYSRSYPVSISRPKRQNTNIAMRNAGIVPIARTIRAERHGCAFASSIRSLSRSYAAASSSSSLTILSRPLPCSTFIPAVEVNASRG